jgi:hypothetical protein
LPLIFGSQYSCLTGIQRGTERDAHGWVRRVRELAA